MTPRAGAFRLAELLKGPLQGVKGKTRCKEEEGYEEGGGKEEERRRRGSGGGGGGGGGDRGKTCRA